MKGKWFDYFHAAIQEMADISKGKQKCTFCGQKTTCFELETSGHGCFACLQRGRFHFDHDTEIGHLTTNGLKRIYPAQKRIPKTFNRAAFSVLLRTPRFPTWQEGTWLIHFDDFMMYLGEWKPKDFAKHSAIGDGRTLFLQMTEKELAHLWDEATPAGASQPVDWYATYYAFRCRHCDALRGYWDCP